MERRLLRLAGVGMIRSEVRLPPLFCVILIFVNFYALLQNKMIRSCLVFSKVFSDAALQNHESGERIERHSLNEHQTREAKYKPHW